MCWSNSRRERGAQSLSETLHIQEPLGGIVDCEEASVFDTNAHQAGRLRFNQPSKVRNLL
jgi:hypothetical protein